jgi:hypothetical protein
MSETDSYKSPFDESSEYDPDQDNGSDYDGQFVNERGDRHSDESSDYYFATKTDPNSSSKKYVRRINPDTKKNTRVEFFPTTPIPNAVIKNAITGAYQGSGVHFFRVGTFDEDLFFSVILATGELGQNPPTLFYDNPEQYERHFFTKVSQQIKDRWTEKKNGAMFHLKSRLRREESEMNGGVVLVK